MEVVKTGGDHNKANAYKAYITERLEGTQTKLPLDQAQVKLTELMRTRERIEGKEDNDSEELGEAPYRLKE